LAHRVKLGPADYYAYIQSDAWRAVKDRYWRSKLPKHCYVCKQPWQPGYHMHHLTYERLGCERLTDITPVCPPHHKMIHRLAKEHGWDVRRASEEARKQFDKKRADFQNKPCAPAPPKPKRPWWQERRRLLKQARKSLHSAPALKDK
jgi:hypothetical protein